jgi:hypothetical protein
MTTPKIKSEEWENEIDTLCKEKPEGAKIDHIALKKRISSIIKEREEAIIKILDEDIYIAQTRKRINPFQDTLFNYEVRVLEDLKEALKQTK